MSSANQLRIALINKSTVFSDNDLRTFQLWMNFALQDFCKEWQLQDVTTFVIGFGKPIPDSSDHPGSNIIKLVILDNTDVQGSYGYHGVSNTLPYARVFAKTILDAGGAVLHSETNGLSIAQVISHEIFELLVNKICNMWIINEAGTAFHVAEVCDPVQGNVFTVDKNIVNTAFGQGVLSNLSPELVMPQLKQKVHISDYVLPSWMNTSTSSRPFNKKNTLNAPLTVDGNGYSIVVKNGSVGYMFGSNVPQALKDKQFASLQKDKRFAALSINPSASA